MIPSFAPFTSHPVLAFVVLLTVSNLFMTFAWYGHLKFKSASLSKVILASWTIAFFEYILMVPANRWGSTVYTATQLKIVQEVIIVVGTAPRSSFESAEVRQSAARDVGEAVAQTPGIFKVRKGGTANDIVLRGFRSQDMNILVDGQRIYGACPNHMDPGRAISPPESGPQS